MGSALFKHNSVRNYLVKFILCGGFIFFVLVFVSAAFMTSALDFGSTSNWYSDAELIKNFQDNEADFERLNKMAEEDSDFSMISNETYRTKESYAYPRWKFNKYLSQERWGEYRNLFIKLHLQNGIDNNQPDKVRFAVASKGMVSGGTSKGYVYLTKEPAPIFDSLDEPSLDKLEFKEKDFRVLYKKLKGNWYLYYSSN